MFLLVYKLHPYGCGWPYPSCLWSGTLTVLQISKTLTPLPSSKTNIMNDIMFTLSSKSPVRNPQRPPSSPFLTPLPDTLLSEISTQNFQGIFPRVKNIIHDIKDPPVLKVSCQEPSTSSKFPLLDPPFLTHFLLRYCHKIFRVCSLG